MVEILNLADRPEFIEGVAKFLHEEWSQHEGFKLDADIYRTKHSICKDGIPQTLIAVEGDELVGTVSLWYNDLKTRQDLSPWMAALYVKPSHRRRGIGRALQEKCVSVARGGV
ncbi:MAG: GNAT family N-acetyltransferase [Alphaproteobacteria bacterium]|nr:GNAT family N-acetyltransferase [Alphaproteobacteria bacterium]